MRYRNINYICSFLCLFFFLSISVSAVTCDSDEIAFLRKKAETITYQTNYVGYVDYQHGYQTYEMYFENLGNDFFIVENNSDDLIKNDRQNFYVQSGNTFFKVYSSKCNVYLSLIEVELPKFNERSLSVLCGGISGDEVTECGTWYQGDITDSELEIKVDEYNDSLEYDDRDLKQRIIDMVVDNYVISLTLVGIVLIVVIILVLRYRKKNILE